MKSFGWSLPSRRAAAALSLVAALAVGLAGCGAGDRPSSDSKPGAATGAGDAGTEGAAGSPKAGVATPPSGGSAGSGTVATGEQIRRSVLADSRHLIRKAALTVQVGDVALAARRAADLVTAAGGTVFAEQTEDDPADRSGSRSTLTIKVPPDRYAAVLRDLAALGTRVEQSQSTEDVTTQVVDVQARIATQKASLARMQSLLSRAGTLGDIVRIEGELTRRQADLESLESQLKALSAQTSLATIVVTFVRAPRTAAPPDNRLGFLPGLQRGWSAFVTVALVGLTALGALLPFLAVGGLVGLVAWRLWLLRRRELPAGGTAGPE